MDRMVWFFCVLLSVILVVGLMLYVKLDNQMISLKLLFIGLEQENAKLSKELAVFLSTDEKIRMELVSLRLQALQSRADFLEVLKLLDLAIDLLDRQQRPWSEPESQPDHRIIPLT